MKAIENKEKILNWLEAMNKGAYGNSKEIVDTYNYIFENIKPKQNYTTCGSCLRRCISIMNTQLQAELQLVEEQKDKESDIQEIIVKEEETKKNKKIIKNKKN